MKTIDVDFDETLLLLVNKKTHDVSQRNETEAHVDIYITPKDRPPPTQPSSKEESP